MSVWVIGKTRPKHLRFGITKWCLILTPIIVEHSMRGNPIFEKSSTGNGLSLILESIPLLFIVQLSSEAWTFRSWKLMDCSIPSHNLWRGDWNPDDPLPLTQWGTVGSFSYSSWPDTLPSNQCSRPGTIYHCTKSTSPFFHPRLYPHLPQRLALWITWSSSKAAWPKIWPCIRK